MNRRIIAPVAFLLLCLLILATAITYDLEGSPSQSPNAATVRPNVTLAPAVAITATLAATAATWPSIQPTPKASKLPGTGGRYSFPKRSELAAYARKQKGCGHLISTEHWKGKSVTLTLQRCVITARFSVKRPSPPPLPTIRPTSTATTLPTATPIPASTPTPVPQDAVSRLLDSINDDRAAHGATPLTLDPVLIEGHPPTCYGARAHAQAMSDGSTIDNRLEIWHKDPRYPAASFSADVCAGSYPIGQNVGAAGGTEDQALTMLQTSMLSEQWAPGCGPPPATFDDHACNLRSAAFHQVGIAAVQGYAGFWFLVETFTA